MSMALAPSVLSFPHSNLSSPVKELMAAGVEWIHFDIMDGQFVPPITFGAEMVASLRGLGDTSFEAHLMTMTPERHFDSFIEAGCSRIIFQAEATNHAYRLCQSLRSSGVQSGVAINPGTPIEELLPLIEVLDLALIMTVNPGWGGQSLIESCLTKVSAMRELAPNLEIEVDGGVSPQNVARIRSAGADTFVVGSFLAKSSSIAAGIAELRECAGA